MREDLSEEEVERVNNVRKQIWKGGYLGFAVGGLSAMCGCLISNHVRKRLIERYPQFPVMKTVPYLQKRHIMMGSLVWGAANMFASAGMEGVRGSESLRDIYEKRAHDAEVAAEQGPLAGTHENLPTPPEFYVAKASADSHTRRMEAIQAKKRQSGGERDGASKDGKFRAW